jgi:hypothetical protein
MSVMPELQHSVTNRPKIFDGWNNPLLGQAQHGLDTLLQDMHRVNSHVCSVRAGTRGKPAIPVSTPCTSNSRLLAGFGICDILRMRCATSTSIVCRHKLASV